MSNWINTLTKYLKIITFPWHTRCIQNWICVYYIVCERTKIENHSIITLCIKMLILTVLVQIPSGSSVCSFDCVCIYICVFTHKLTKWKTETIINLTSSSNLKSSCVPWPDKTQTKTYSFNMPGSHITHKCTCKTTSVPACHLHHNKIISTHFWTQLGSSREKKLLVMTKHLFWWCGRLLKGRCPEGQSKLLCICAACQLSAQLIADDLGVLLLFLWLGLSNCTQSL